MPLKTIHFSILEILSCLPPIQRRHGFRVRRLRIRIKALLKNRRGECNVPKDVIESLAEAFLPEIRAFFESEEGKREFEEWKRERKMKLSDKKPKYAKNSGIKVGQKEK